MKSVWKLMLLGALALMIVAPATFAQTPESSILPVTEPLDVGGTILQPGSYLIRVLPSRADRNKVQVTSQDGNTVYATVLTVPHVLKPNEEMPNTMFVFYPPGEGMPRALRTWFAPNPEASLGGHDIVYEESRAKQLARLASSRVVAYPPATAVADLDTTPLEVVTPEATVETYTYVAPPRAPRVVVAEAQPLRMPRTAGKAPLLALLGLLSLGGAVAFRVARG